MNFTIPNFQRAAVIENPGPHGQVILRNDVPVGVPGPKEVLVKVNCTGVCKSDVRALLGWSSYMPIVSHEGVGIVVKLGHEVSAALLGQRVGVKWLHSACGNCYCCNKGFPNNCPSQINTGRNVLGTLQEYVVAHSAYITPIPPQIPDEIAAPLLCGGLTMLGALSKLDGELSKGDWVVISGSGGGLGHFGVQIASRLKEYRVIAMDYGESKRVLSVESGAQHYVDLAIDDPEKAIKDITGSGAAAVLVVSGSEDAFWTAPKLVRNMGTIVCIGLPRNDFNIPIPVSTCSARALTVTGTSTGTERQMKELLDYAVQGVISPVVEVLGFEEIPVVFQRLQSDRIVGRVVVRIATS